MSDFVTISAFFIIECIPFFLLYVVFVFSLGMYIFLYPILCIILLLNVGFIYFFTDVYIFEIIGFVYILIYVVNTFYY